MKESVLRDALIEVLDAAEHDHLLYDSKFLLCLRKAGVESWEGYELACAMYHEGGGDGE